MIAIREGSWYPCVFLKGGYQANGRHLSLHLPEEVRKILGVHYRMAEAKNFLYAFCGKRKVRPTYNVSNSADGRFTAEVNLL